MWNDTMRLTALAALTGCLLLTGCRGDDEPTADEPAAMDRRTGDDSITLDDAPAPGRNGQSNNSDRAATNNGADPSRSAAAQPEDDDDAMQDDNDTAPSGLPGDPVTGDPTVTASGLMYYELTPGTGERPASPIEQVTVRYTGYNMDGNIFDSSGEAAVTYPLNIFIAGWIEGVGSMKVGGKRKFVIPPDLAWGTNPPRGASIKPGETLVFDVELVGIEPYADVDLNLPPTAESLPGEPATGEVKHTAHDIAYWVIKEGSGEKPKFNHTVRVAYTGWLMDGREFGSTATGGVGDFSLIRAPVTGWIESILDMNVGEKRKIVVPHTLGFRDPNTGLPPRSNLVFDLELLAIVE